MDIELNPFDIARDAPTPTKDKGFDEKLPASNQARSKTLLGRLNELLRTCDPANVPSYKGRFSRIWFAERIHCSASTLTTSVRLRKALNVWEEKHRKKMVPTERRTYDDTNVVLLGRKSTGRIVRVPVTISQALSAQTKTVPTLVWEDGMDEWVADYARHLTFRVKNGTSSVEETVKKLRQFRRFQRTHGVQYHQVDDDFLLAFQGALESDGRSTTKRRDEVLSAVHDFFKWADGRGLLTNHVQTAPKGEYSDLPDDYVFPISSEQVSVSGRHGQAYLKWVSTLAGGAEHSTYGARHTPTSSEVLELGEIVETHGRHKVRNRLIMDWALLTGARVSEIVQIRESDLPPFDDISAFFSDDGSPKMFEVWVERKNRGRSMLRVPDDLALRTAEYIACDPERLAIVNSGLGGTRRNDNFVFLSERTGEALVTDSITRIFRTFFKKAGIKKANIHRLRAKFITEKIEMQLDRLQEGGVYVDPTSNWEETVLVMAAKDMGHLHPVSLMPYLHDILQKRQTKDGELEVRSAESRAQSLKSFVNQMQSRLETHAGLAEVARLLEGEKVSEAIDLLGDVQDQLRELIGIRT
ncbi:tyrosine-type recombinase/integrase [Agrobacterium sp. B1(2019)]|uniref:tyrosine-type recombinase/integrase n=1 Tax=Agrobacterium sp. B1(2019) TaxID=2607032 RepID=UPI0011EC24C6|nr:tyrosine-type recombinase/integrase [Agrobacterium sp. B1(2019)]TZG36494.1 tyrosine-type recombinase/integrase [Agrobacterium sp. B1(2019)]